MSKKDDFLALFQFTYNTTEQLNAKNDPTRTYWQGRRDGMLAMAQELGLVDHTEAAALMLDGKLAAPVRHDRRTAATRARLALDKPRPIIENGKCIGYSMPDLRARLFADPDDRAELERHGLVRPTNRNA